MQTTLPKSVTSKKVSDINVFCLCYVRTFEECDINVILLRILFGFYRGELWFMSRLEKYIFYHFF